MHIVVYIAPSLHGILSTGKKKEREDIIEYIVFKLEKEIGEKMIRNRSRRKERRNGGK